MDRKIGPLTVRELTGFCLLLLLLASGMLCSWYMGKQHRAMSRELERCGWMALSGQWSDAREGAQNAKTSWERNRGLRAAVSDHTPMEQIDELFAELTVYGAAGERTEFARCCAELAVCIKAVGEAHDFSWWNVL